VGLGRILLPSPPQPPTELKNSHLTTNQTDPKIFFASEETQIYFN
jgi:hypothetical protein